jgi:ethanolamine kinase
MEDIEIPDDEVKRHSVIRQFVAGLLPEFADCITDQQIGRSILSGGVTNQLYKVWRVDKPEVAVVVRVFGKETERIISRNAELFWQSQFLRTFGKCRNGLAYEFLAGFKELTPQEMIQYTRVTAIAMARFHLRATTAALLTPPYSTEVNFTHKALKTWFDIALSPECQAKVGHRTSHLDLPSRAATALRLSDAIEALADYLPQGACHNDLLGANIMLRRGSDGLPVVAEGAKGSLGDFDEHVRLIDFEYAHRNYFYYDIANHFNEFGGLEADWSKYPSDAKAIEFIQQYITTFRGLTLKPGSERVSPSVDATQVLGYVKLLSMASHLIWGAWSVIQAAFSVIEFDYLTYAAQRFQGYDTINQHVQFS